jgi:hypothetical protein
LKAAVNKQQVMVNKQRGCATITTEITSNKMSDEGLAEYIATMFN